MAAAVPVRPPRFVRVTIEDVLRLIAGETLWRDDLALVPDVACKTLPEIAAAYRSQQLAYERLRKTKLVEAGTQGASTPPKQRKPKTGS